MANAKPGSAGAPCSAASVPAAKSGKEARGPGRRRAILRRLFRYAEHVLALLGLSFLIYHVAFDLSVVVSDSMAPTLRGSSMANGDRVLTEKVSYWFRRPRRWEVVTFRKSDGIQVMKRVVGLPGERVSLKNRQVAVNGELAACPEKLTSLRYLAYGKLFRGQAADCEKGYFVLGDETEDSQDSRFEGPIARSEIIGRAWLVVWPPRRLGFVNP